jgi:hypothetical protein
VTTFTCSPIGNLPLSQSATVCSSACRQEIPSYGNDCLRILSSQRRCDLNRRGKCHPILRSTYFVHKLEQDPELMDCAAQVLTPLRTKLTATLLIFRYPKVNFTGIQSYKLPSDTACHVCRYFRRAYLRIQNISSCFKTSELVFLT